MANEHVVSMSSDKMVSLVVSMTSCKKLGVARSARRAKEDWFKIKADWVRMYSLHLFNFSKKICNARSIVLYDPAIFTRFFSRDTGIPVLKGEDLLRPCRRGSVPENRAGGLSFSAEDIPSTLRSFNYRPKDFDIFKVIWLGVCRKQLSGTNLDIPVANLVFNEAFSCSTRSSRRGYSTDSGLPPHQEIGMPSLSPTMTEGNIARWLKKEGDKVSPGEVLCEVETDKATVEMECMEEGYIAKIIHGDGAKDIKVGEVIAVTVEEEDDIPKFKDYSGPSAAAVDTSSTPPKKDVQEPASLAEPNTAKETESLQADDRVFMSPLARKLAQDHNVPLSSIKGTGPEGRILKADIEDYLASSAKTGPTSFAKAKDETIMQKLDYSALSHSQIRKVTASRLLLSKQTIPHYYLTVDTCVDKLMDLRAQLNSLQEATNGKRISVNDFVIKAAALALVKVPQCNSSWTDEYIRQYHHVNINVAVQTDNGLFVPVIRDADKKGLSTIGEEVKHLAQKAKDNSLKPEDYEGGTFTVSNLGGPFGIKQFCAIINPPQAGILAVGSAEKRVIPGVGSNEFDVGSFMTVTLSCDHRVIDGAIGAEWLKAFKGYIENPMSMLL